MGQQDLTRGDLSQRQDLLDSQPLLVQQTTLDDQCLVYLGELLEHLGYADRITGRTVRLFPDKSDGRRTDQQIFNLEAQLVDGETHQGVLVNLVLAAGLAQGTT